MGHSLHGDIAYMQPTRKLSSMRLFSRDKEKYIQLWKKQIKLVSSQYGEKMFKLFERLLNFEKQLTPNDNDR